MRAASTRANDALAAVMPIALIAPTSPLVSSSGDPGRAVEPGITRWSSNPAGRFPELGGGADRRARARLQRHRRSRRAVCIGRDERQHPRGGDPCCLDDIPAVIRAACAVEIDGGNLPGVASTVVDLSGSVPRVLRRGAR
jgi:hypothetical protein